MDDAGVVRNGERIGDLTRERQGLGDRNGATPDAHGQILALDELHGDEGVGAFPTGVIDLRDVGMIERGEGLRLARESHHPIGI